MTTGEAKLIYEGNEYGLPVLEGTEGERAIDVQDLRDQTGLVTYDPGYGNTGSCKSAITFVDGEKGILRYRGYPIEELATKEWFSEVCYLLIYGKRLPKEEFIRFRAQLTAHSMIHEDMKKIYDAYPPTAHPMAIMAALVASMPAFYPDDSDMDLSIVRILAKAKTIAAFAYKKSIGEPFTYPLSGLSWPANFLHMMFAVPTDHYEVPKVLEDALNLLLILHADHEQNCSTSTMRMVGSSQANLYASIAAAICALSGSLHGGANEQVIKMLQEVHASGDDFKSFLDKVKSKKSGIKLMGFGHRVYKNFDPRAKLLKHAMERLFGAMNINDPLLEIATRLEETALKDQYFIERKLYPNVDFYSGILYHAIGIPMNMFTVMFALGRLPGWIAHWKEMKEGDENRLHRPRQIYTGPRQRPLEDAGTKNF